MYVYIYIYIHIYIYINTYIYIHICLFPMLRVFEQKDILGLFEKKDIIRVLVHSALDPHERLMFEHPEHVLFLEQRMEHV